MMEVSIADFVDDDFEEIMKDLDVVDSWINDEDESEESLDEKNATSHETSKIKGDLKLKKNIKMDLMSKDKLCEVVGGNKKNLEGSSMEPISDLEEKGSGSVKKCVTVEEKNKSKSGSREARKIISRDTRKNVRDGSSNTRDSRHGNRDGYFRQKEGQDNYRERNTERNKSGYHYSRELLLSPGREFRRRRVERSPNHYGNSNRREISKTLRDIRKDKEQKDSVRQLHNKTRRTRSRSLSNSRSILENLTQIENDCEPHPLRALQCISPSVPFFNVLNDPANLYVPMEAQGKCHMYHTGPGFQSMYNPNIGNPVIIPIGGYDLGMELRPSASLSYECYSTPHIAEPMHAMQPMYSASVAAPILVPEGMPPVESRPPPGSQEALDKLLADKSISLEDYLKLTTRPKAPTADFAKPRSQSVEKRNELMDRCQDAVAKLTKLQLPKRLIVSHAIREPVRQSDVKYCSPLKRRPAVRYNFTTPAKNASQQNKQLLSSVLTTVGLEKMLLPDKKTIKQKKNTRDAAVQTAAPLCDKCEVLKSIETYSKETSIDHLYLTKSVPTQVIEKDLANSKSIFTPNDSFDGPTISLSHMTPAQILASKLSTKAKSLKSNVQQVTNPYETDMSRGFTRRQPFSKYEQIDMYDAKCSQEELFKQRVSHNDEMYDQRRQHNNQMHYQNNQLFQKRSTPDDQTYNPY